MCGGGSRQGYFLGLAILVLAFEAFPQQVRKVTPKGTRYLLYTPKTYPASAPYPLLVVLHGQGNLGDDLTMLEQGLDEMPSRLIARGRWPDHYPFVVVTPQLERDESIPNPRDQSWPPGMVDELIEVVKKDYAIDASRIYITGLSKGARGSFDYAATYPHKIAAMALIAGAHDSTRACDVKNIPMWLLHGTDDDVVPPVFMDGVIRNVGSCPPRGKFKPRRTLLYGRRHEGWNEVYNGTAGFDIYKWMLMFRKNSSANVPPYVHAGSDMTIAVTSSLHLYADVHDADGEVTRVEWRKRSGPDTNIKTLPNGVAHITDLVPGTYEFEVEAWDDDGATTLDLIELRVINTTDMIEIKELILLDGSNQQVMSKLFDGYVVRPQSLDQGFINIEALPDPNVESVVFRVNGFQMTRLSNDPPYRLAKPRWTVEEGQYVVCATPYTRRGANGSAGISKCFAFTVSSTAGTPESPVEEPPLEEPPPSDEPPPSEEPPAEEPPAEEPPTEEPPVDEPPAQQPPAEEPPSEEPPVDEPPVEEPADEDPPVTEPSNEEPPDEEAPPEEPNEESPVSEPTDEEPQTSEPPEEIPNLENPIPDDSVILGLEQDPAYRVNLYPNPARLEVIIDVQPNPATTVSCIVTHVTGSVVYKTQWSPIHTPLRIDARTFSPGVYFLVLSSGQDVIARKRFAIQ